VSDSDGDPAKAKEYGDPYARRDYPKINFFSFNTPTSEHDIPHGLAGQGVGKELGDGA